MTRQVTVTNTSNWDGEGYFVEMPDGEKIHLSPGESVSFTPRHDTAHPDYGEGNEKELPCMPVAIREYRAARQAPFVVPATDGSKRKDKQVFPKVTVEFE